LVFSLAPDTGSLPTLYSVAKIFMPIYDQLLAAYKELEDDQEMVSPAQVCGMFVDWTDPQKAM